MIELALRQTGGNKKATQALGLSRQGVIKKLKRWKLEVRDEPLYGHRAMDFSQGDSMQSYSRNKYCDDYRAERRVNLKEEQSF